MCVYDLVPGKSCSGSARFVTQARRELPVLLQVQNVRDDLVRIVGLKRDRIMARCRIVLARRTEETQAAAGHRFEAHQTERLDPADLKH